MQEIQPYDNPLLSSTSSSSSSGSIHGFHLDMISLSSTTTSTTTKSIRLALDAAETTEDRIRQMVSENPVVIFSRSSSCCMCHVIRQLLSNLGVHPAVIVLDEDEIAVLTTSGVVAIPMDEEEIEFKRSGDDGRWTIPAVFIGGMRVGGIESVVALHLRGQLVPLLAKAGAIEVDRSAILWD